MEVQVTWFRSPFSFFCLPVEDVAHVIKAVTLPDSNCPIPSCRKNELSGASHGQYVAVLWNDRWARGIVTMENQFQIWLIDYGFYLRVTDQTVFVNLPPDDKKYPTKVFEASLHGVVPVDQVFVFTENENCEVKNEVTTEWKQAATQRAKNLIAIAAAIYLAPVAVLSTNANDIVIGDIHLQMKGGSVINLKKALEQWPVFLQKSPEFYIENLPNYYIQRRQHRASLVKPALPMEVPKITPQVTFAEYSAICANAPELEFSQCTDSSEEGSTLTDLETVIMEHAYKPTPEEIEKYSTMYITVTGREYNVLNVMCNKARDLSMCKYADKKYIGRATSRSSRLYPELED